AEHIPAHEAPPYTATYQRRSAMERMLELVAGLDVHKQTVAVCIKVPGDNGARHQHVRTFGATLSSSTLSAADRRPSFAGQSGPRSVTRYLGMAHLRTLSGSFSPLDAHRSLRGCGQPAPRRWETRRP